MSHSPGCVTTDDEGDGIELPDLMDLGTDNEDLGENLELCYDMDEADPAHDVPMTHATKSTSIAPLSVALARTSGSMAC